MSMLVMNNASTDGALECLHEWLPLHLPQPLIALDQNTGGAGGFTAGMKHAVDSGSKWIWMMDDDAEPHPDALEQLMRVAVDPSQVYGSLAVSGNETSWLTTVLAPPLGEVGQAGRNTRSVPCDRCLSSVFLIHRDLVAAYWTPRCRLFHRR